MEKKIVYIISAVLLVVALVLAVYGLTGRAISSEALGRCMDSDGGLDYYTQGTTSYENRDTVYIDYCVQRGKLKEYYCGGGGLNIQSKRESCLNGCIDGACVK